MSWTVIVEGESGEPIKRLPDEFWLSHTNVLCDGSFKLLHHLDPYGDTTFNALMFDDLIVDLAHLKIKLPTDGTRIDDVLALVLEGKKEVHTYLKFYDD